MLRGEPLIGYTIRAAQAANRLTDWVVSTEDKEIADLALSYGAYVIKRPPELAQDDTTSGAVVRHALDWMEDTGRYDMVVLLHPTSPIRDPQHIDQAISMLERTEDADTLASVRFLPKKTHENIYSAEGEPVDGTFILNASIYAMKRDWFVKNNTHVGGRAVFFPMDRYHSVDVDEEADLKIAEVYLNALLPA